MMASVLLWTVGGACLFFSMITGTVAGNEEIKTGETGNGYYVVSLALGIVGALCWRAA